MPIFLNPTWDIVPSPDGTTLYPPDAAPFTLPLTRELLYALRDGTTPPAGTETAVADLLARGGALEDSAERAPYAGTHYLALLKNRFVGPGRIMTSVSEYGVSATPFAGSFYVAYADGFAPRLIPGQSSRSGGWGADTDRRLAGIKAIVEGIERYALGEYDRTTLVSATWEDMKAAALSPTQLGSTEQRLTKAGPLDWVRLESLAGTAAIHAPLDFLHHPVDYTELGRMPVAALNISGVAAHQSREAALVNACLELCEHEALMVAWFGGRVTPTIRHASLDPVSQAHISRLKKMGWEVILKDVTLDLVPVVMAVGLGPVGKRALTIGSCAAFSSRYAAAKALTEVIRTVLVDEASPADFIQIDKGEVADVLGHGLYFASPDHLEEAARLWEGGGETDATDNLTHGPVATLHEALLTWKEPEELEYVAKTVIVGSGIGIYATDITPRRVREEGVPLAVMRAVGPEMARITVGFGRRPADTGRFRRLIAAYGGTEAPGDDSLHPFS